MTGDVDQPRFREALGVRAYNERLILDEIRRRGPLSKAEIARVTGLSAQAASVIVNALIDDGMLLKQGKVRGNVGQPFTPMALNPTGAFAIGVNLGRRSLEATLIDFSGTPIRKARLSYAFPQPDEVLTEIKTWTRDWLSEIEPDHRGRIVGLGMAAPRDLDGWPEEVRVARQDLLGWRDLNLSAWVEKATGLQVTLVNDATAACAAEIQKNQLLKGRCAIYFYVGAFVGGGVVLDGKLVEGVQRNAGAVGSMIVPGAGAKSGQLLGQASLITLEQALTERGLAERASLALASPGNHDSAGEAAWAQWLRTAAPALAVAVSNASAVIDFEMAVIDGSLHPRRRSELVEATAIAFESLDRTGLSPMTIEEGSVGDGARSLGAAILPMQAAFNPDARMIAPVPAQRDTSGV